MAGTPEPVPSFDVIIPTVGRPTLAPLLDALAAGRGPLPERVLIVDDRRHPEGVLLSRQGPAVLARRVVVLRGCARGPAAARNIGWWAGAAAWAAFLDDDVVPETDWREHLAGDLGAAAPDVAGVQGCVRVPMPFGRKPTDWERNVRGLEEARWATADMAYRRVVLEQVGGFDERFPRAYREDLDLALRVLGAGWRLERGRRCVSHPVRPAGRWISVRAQAGNADDALMAALHGPRWRRRAGLGEGRRPRHLAITAAAVLGLVARHRGHRMLAMASALAWLAGTAELAWARIAPGPRTAHEIATMLATSAVVPGAAACHWLWGWLTLPWRLRRPAPRRERPRAILFDRDGTLVVDVPHNGDPRLVVPVPRAREVLDRLRAAGVRMAVVSNQSGVGRGLLTAEQVRAVNRRIEEVLGPIGPWFWCAHAPGDGCGCRKPAPGLIVQAAAALGVPPAHCVVIGDTGADMEAARAAGARAVLVPTPVTRREEIAAAPAVASDLAAAVEQLFGRNGGAHR